MTDPAPDVRLEGDLRPFLDDEAVPLLRRYFGIGTDERFTGRAFDVLGGRGDDPSVRDVITPADLLAVEMLSVQVPPEASIAILGELAGEISALLARIPHDVDIWDADLGDLDDTSAADALWRLLRTIDRVGPVITSKLLARKRPRLIPIVDAYVRKALQPRLDAFWIPLRLTLREDPSLVARLHHLHEVAGLPQHISLLRVLDVAVWMRQRPSRSTAEAG